MGKTPHRVRETDKHVSIRKGEGFSDKLSQLRKKEKNQKKKASQEDGHTKIPEDIKKAKPEKNFSQKAVLDLKLGAEERTIKFGRMSVDEIHPKQLAICQACELEGLMVLSQHSSTEVSSLAARTISYLSYDMHNEVVITHKSGFIPLKYLTTFGDELEVQAEALWVFARLSEVKGNLEPIVEQVGWDHIIEFIESDVSNIQAGAAKLLGSLADSDKNRKKLIHLHVVGLLCQRLNDAENVHIENSVLWALLKIISTENASAAVSGTDLTLLLLFIENTKDQGLLDNAMSLFAVIANSDGTRLKKMLLKKGLNHLLRVMKIGDENVRHGCVMCVYGLSTLDEGIQPILDHNFVKEMIEMMDLYESQSQLGLLLTFNNLIRGGGDYARQKLKSPELLKGVEDIYVYYHSNDDNELSSDIMLECEDILNRLDPGKMRKLQGTIRR